MNAPFKPPVTLPPIPLHVLAEAALNAWARDRRAYKAGFCDDPAPYPMCWHTFEGDAAPVQAVCVMTEDGAAYVRLDEVGGPLGGRAAASFPSKGEPAR